MIFINNFCLKHYFDNYFCIVCSNFFQKNLLHIEYCYCGCEESILCCEGCVDSNFVQITEFCGC